MKSFLPMTGVLLLFILVGVACTAQQGSVSDGIYKKAPLEKTTGQDQPRYQENKPPEVLDNSKQGRAQMNAYVPGQVIIKFKEGTDEIQAGVILSKHFLKKMNAMPLPDVYLVRILSDDSVDEVIEKLSKEAAVVYAEPNFLMQTQQ